MDYKKPKSKKPEVKPKYSAKGSGDRDSGSYEFSGEMPNYKLTSGARYAKGDGVVLDPYMEAVLRGGLGSIQTRVGNSGNRTYGSTAANLGLGNGHSLKLAGRYDDRADGIMDPSIGYAYNKDNLALALDYMNNTSGGQNILGSVNYKF